jgi:hypothetical protein
MDIGSGLACRLGRLGRSAVSLGGSGWLAILVVAVTSGAVITGLAPAPEP